MDRVIEIDGKPVKFRATAAVPRLYRLKYRRDIMQDMAAIQKDINKAQEEGGVPVASLELFENCAYIMAKHADPEGVPGTIDEWLDGFDTFSIYQVFPEIAELWTANMETSAVAKKNNIPAPVR